MTRFAPLWQQGGSYPALVDRSLLSSLWPQTGFTGAKATVVPNTMQVSIPPGTAAVALAAGAGTVLCRWDAPELVTHPAAPVAGQSRIDRIVLQVRDAALDAGANNDFVFQVIPGTPSTGTPAAPPVPTNAAPMYTLTIPGAAANLNGVAVADGRGPMPLPGAGARVYQTIPMNYITGITKVNFDTVEYDTSGFWDQPNQWMACPATGLYLINARAETSAVAAVTARVFLELATCSGRTLARGPDFAFTNQELQIGAMVTAMTRLAAGDCVYLNMFQNTGATRTGNTGQSATFMEFALLGSA